VFLGGEQEHLTELSVTAMSFCLLHPKNSNLSEDGPMAAKKFVLMNHTNMQGHHFGCARVMRIIEDGLQVRGGEIIGRLDGKQNWQTTPEALAILAQADGIVINGEGTLHGGRKKAGWLVDIADHPVSKGKELSLINTIYQNNPPEWGSRLARFDHIYARESRSAAALTQAVGRPVPWLGDLSTSAGALPDNGQARSGVMVGDSVHNTVSAGLAKFSRDMSPQADLIPLTISLREENPYRPWLIRQYRHYTLKLRQAVQERRYPNLRYLSSEEAYLDLLRTKSLSVTGRFHGICLNLAAGTPFICISSNSWKIEALFDDVGLNPRRLIALADLSPQMVADHDWSFDDKETANIAAYLQRTQSQAADMFDKIVG